MKDVLLGTLLLLATIPSVNAQENAVIEKICKESGIRNIVDRCGDYIVVSQWVSDALTQVYDSNGKLVCHVGGMLPSSTDDCESHIDKCQRHNIPAEIDKTFDGDACAGIPAHCDESKDSACKEWNKYIRKLKE